MVDNDYISRNAAQDEACDRCNQQGHCNRPESCPIMISIKNIPAADVRPVVLCRDCKRYGGRPWENNETGICARTDCGVGEDDFCSYGEKLEES